MTSLQRLYEVTLEEREAARDLDMDRLMVLLREKEELLPLLEETPDLSPEEKELARTVLYENRRNAYLYNSALNWTSENISLLQSATAPPIYGRSGGMVEQTGDGNLLSGKV
jgi:hypothetical protein